MCIYYSWCYKFYCDIRSNEKSTQFKHNIGIQMLLWMGSCTDFNEIRRDKLCKNKCTVYIYCAHDHCLSICLYTRIIFDLNIKHGLNELCKIIIIKWKMSHCTWVAFFHVYDLALQLCSNSKPHPKIKRNVVLSIQYENGKFQPTPFISLFNNFKYA